MTDDSHRRPDDHLVEPMFAALQPTGEEPGEGPRADVGATRRGCLGGAAALLLFAAWLATASCARREATSAGSGARFAEVAAEVGLGFRHGACATGRFALPEIMGAGCALVDVDGRLDAYSANGAPTLGTEQVGERPRNRLYLQPQGGSFRDATDAWNAGVAGWSTSAEFAYAQRGGPVAVRHRRPGAPLSQRRPARRNVARGSRGRGRAAALGARIEVVDGERHWRRTLRTGSRYQSVREPGAHFGRGLRATIDRVDVRRPDGAGERFPGGPTDRRVVLSCGEGTVLP